MNLLRTTFLAGVSFLVLVASQCLSASEVSLKPIPHKSIVVDGQKTVVVNGTIVWVECK